MWKTSANGLLHWSRVPTFETSIVKHAAPDFGVFSLAQLLVGVAHQFPGRVGQFFRAFDVGIRPADSPEFGKDILPLPRPCLDVYRSLTQGCPALFRSRRKQLYHEATIELWNYLAIMSVNFLFVG